MNNLRELSYKHFTTALCSFIFMITACTTNNDQDNRSDIGSLKEETLNAEPVSYEIVNTEDLSRKPTTSKKLSEYTVSELESLPTNRKMLYKVVLAHEIKESQVKATIEKVVNDIIEKDNDIDEIALNLYSDKTLTEGAYDIGTAIWAPFGKLGNVTPEIAKSNNRESYNITYEIKDNLDEYLTQRQKSEDKFDLTEEDRRRYYKEIVAAENRASKEVKKMNLTDAAKYYDKEDELMEKYRTEVRKKYNLSKEQASEISNEAFEEEWALR